MKKKTLLTIVCVILVLGLGAGIYIVRDKIKKNNARKREIENNIVENYQTFREKVEDFNEERKIYSMQVESDLFAEEVYKYEDWIVELDKYSESIKEVESVSEYLKENCVGHFYSKQDIKNKCEAFIIAYETAYNYYVKDIINFNDKMKEYSTEKNKLEEYELEYNYVDINKDGKFYGKD